MIFGRGKKREMQKTCGEKYKLKEVAEPIAALRVLTLVIFVFLDF